MPNYAFWTVTGTVRKLTDDAYAKLHVTKVSSISIHLTSVVDPNTLNLDPDPEFWPNLDPDPW